MPRDEDTVIGVIGNGRFDFLKRAIESIEENVQYNWRIKILVDDTGDREYGYKLQSTFPDWHLIQHSTNQGLSGSVRTLWSAMRMLEAEYLFHVEEDFVFSKKIDIESMKGILKTEETLAQIALKRQPVNGDEASVGGFMQQARDTYYEKIVRVPRPSSVEFNHDTVSGYKDFVITTHRNFFTLNPSLYSIELINLGWEKGWGEKEFSERLFNDEKARFDYCGFMGGIDDPPVVDHIGNYRGGNWFV